MGCGSSRSVAVAPQVVTTSVKTAEDPSVVPYGITPQSNADGIVRNEKGHDTPVQHDSNAIISESLGPESSDADRDRVFKAVPLTNLTNGVVHVDVPVAQSNGLNSNLLEVQSDPLNQSEHVQNDSTSLTAPANRKAEGLWFGEQIPVLKKFFRPAWIKAAPDSQDQFILQAAYHDRYGDFNPMLSVKLRTCTYKYGAGSLLEGHVIHRKKIAIVERMVSDKKIRNAKPRKNVVSAPKEANGGDDFTMLLMQMVRRQYAVNTRKFERIVRKAQEEYTLCIFLSSPFDGCEKERKYFMESTVLELSALCERKGIALSVVDMRWGITDELSSSNKTIKTCLQALDDSDILIGYFGARYGSSNLIYDVRPSWIDKSLDECTQSVYPFLRAYSDVSITEMEWLHAFTHEKNYEDVNKPVSFFLFRDPKYDKDMEDRYISENNEKMSKVFRVENPESAQAYDKLRSTVKDICSLDAIDDKGYKNRYGAFFDRYPNPLVGAKIMESCVQILIKYLLVEINPPVKGLELRQAHTAFAKSRLVMFLGVEDVLQQAEEYLRNRAPVNENIPQTAISLVLKAVKKMDVRNQHLVARQYDRPLVLCGQSGGGKSSIMAYLALRAKSADSYVIHHFVGCNAGSTFLKGMLERLYSEFQSFVAERIRNYTFKSFELLDLNQVLYEMCSTYEDLGSKIPPLNLVIDAINQLVDDAYNDLNDLPSELKWLPPQFPPGMRVVISCLEMCSVYNGAMLNVLQSRSSTIVRVASLDLKARRNIVHRWHAHYHKAVDESVMRPLWEHEASANPMYLSLALKQLILHGSYATLKQYCDSLLSAPTVPLLLQNIITEVANATFIGGIARPDIVKSVFQLVFCSREGLSGVEIIELLRLEQQRQEATGVEKPRPFLDDTSWIPLVYSLQQLLVARRGLFNFTHDYVRQSVEALYFCEGSSFDELKAFGPKEAFEAAKSRKIIIHKWLATFFQVRADIDNVTLTFQDEYPRPMRELTYHQRMANIRPSVLVAARVRPLSEREMSLNESDSICRMKGKQVMILNPKTKKPTIFNLDFAFDSSDPKSTNYASQERVYNLCGADVISETLEGHNVSIFAYGQTGSGKSYTMFGTSENPGIIPLTLKELLRQLDLKQKQTGWIWEAKCTMVEIYLNEIRDLLSGGVVVHLSCQKEEGKFNLNQEEMAVNGFKELEKLLSKERQEQIEQHKDDPAAKESTELSKTCIVPVTLSGAHERSVTAFADIISVIQEGEAHRTTDATLMNDTSSRSHCIFTLTVTQKLESGQTGQSIHSKINLVDLAGSERGAKSGHLSKKLLKEAIAINSSLSVLNECIRALTDPTVRHIPYRQSKLTWMLQDSLGGNAKTVLLATLSPASNNFAESISTLQYAAMAKRMPNSLKKDLDTAALLSEAEGMRKEEMEARTKLCEEFGFSESHLDLLREYYTTKSEATFQWLDPSSTTWKKDLDLWQRTLEDLYAGQQSGQLIRWSKGFRASCTDASQQRYLKAKPGEDIRIELIYCHKETVSTCIIQFQIAVDIFHPVANISQICQDSEMDRLKRFSLRAPGEPGLYMIWSKGNYHFSFAQAEAEYPKNYDRCEDWYRGFIAW